MTGQTAVAAAATFWEREPFPTMSEAELHLAGAKRGWDPARCPTHSAHPDSPHGVCVVGCGPGEPGCHPATAAPAACHQQRASLRREGPGGRSVSCQLRVSRHLSCSKASHSLLWKGEGRFKDTAACRDYVLYAWAKS